MLTASTISAAFAPIADEDAWLIAVSGGPDSLALLHMATAWAANHPRIGLFAATVDHGLRAESAGEARVVADHCASLGVPHAVLRWEGAKPKSRLQERAREARYALLFQEARRCGARVVLTAHHADDQAETILFRLARGSGIAGLAGMSAVTKVHGAALVRPLLDIPKAALVAYCRKHGLAAIDDPSNRDVKYARARLRTLTPLLAAEGLDAAAFSRLARRMRRAEEALRAETARLLEHLGDGPAYPGAPLLDAPAEIALRALGALFARAQGPDGSAPGLDKLEAIEAKLRGALLDRKRHRINVGGVELNATADGRITLGAERARRQSAPSAVAN